MKIAVDGNLGLAKTILEVKDKLEELGHDIYIPQGIRSSLDVSNIPGQEQVVQSQDSTRNSAQSFWQEMQETEAFLVINDNGSNQYAFIGASILMEIGFASVLNQKIYFLYPVGNDPYKANIEAVKPIVLNGDLSKLM